MRRANEKKVIISGLIILLLVVIFLLFSKKNNVTIDENTLYSTKINDVTLRIQRYDYSLGQNQIVGVEKSVDGKTFDKVTLEPITISMEPMFTFINEKLGFIISKTNLSKSNNYMGFKVTMDGGKTFNNAIINYNNPNIEVLTITSVPYFNNDYLVLPCSIYKVNEDNTGYENVSLFLVSNDNGFTWNVDNNIKESDIVDKINVVIDNIKYEAKLENNETVKEFIKLLPGEFNMTELNGNEKYIYLNNNLPSNPISIKHINKGDIMLYGSNCLVIFYESFETSYSYTKIGHIDNLGDLGNGNIVVKIEKVN